MAKIFGLLFEKTQNFFHFLIFTRVVTSCNLQDCRSRLPGQTAGPDCRARLPGPTAGPDCRARLPGQTARQLCPAALPGSLAEIVQNYNRP
jgi:hypothetical protein